MRASHIKIAGRGEPAGFYRDSPHIGRIAPYLSGRRQPPSSNYSELINILAHGKKRVKAERSIEILRNLSRCCAKQSIQQHGAKAGRKTHHAPPFPAAPDEALHGSAPAPPGRHSAFAVLFGAVFNELAAALGEGHVDPVIVGGGIFVVGANPRIGILFLAMGSPRRYHSTDRTKCPLCNDTLHGDTMYHYIKRRDPLGKWKNYCVLGDFVL